MTRAITIDYRSTNCAALSADLFAPERTSSPVVLCIHGGGWISGDRSMMHDVAASLADEGFAAVCPQYRLAPEHPYPAAVDDLMACIAELRRRENELGIDTARLATLGNSAGGHLAALVGLQLPARAVVAISAITDLTAPASDPTDLGAVFVAQFLQASPTDTPDLYREASPIASVTAAAPPFLIVHGDSDDLVPVGQSTTLHDALCRAGAKSSLHVIPGEGHSYTYSAWARVEQLYTSFLKEHLCHA